MSKDNTSRTGNKGILRDKKGRLVKGTKCINPSGRPIGLRDKATQIKMALLEAFDRLGGIDRFVEWANDKPANVKEFYKLLVAVLPKDFDVKTEGEGKDMKIIIVNPQKPAPNKAIDNRIANDIAGNDAPDANADENK